MNGDKIKSFIKRHSLVLGIMMIMIISFAFVVPWQLNTGGEINTLNEKLLSAKSVDDHATAISLQEEISSMQTKFTILSTLMIPIFIFFLWGLWMILNGFTLYAFTDIDFLEEFSKGGDGNFSEVERVAFFRVISSSQIANAILILAVIVGAYFVFFS